MNYINLLKILLEWSINAKEYETVYFIYINFNIGITVRFLYKLPDIHIFSSLSSFNLNHDSKKIDNKYLEKLFNMFKQSKYVKLRGWNDSYGYLIREE